MYLRLASVLVLGVLAVRFSASAHGDERPSRWEKAVVAFEKQDAAKPPTKGGIVFVGSSSIRLWKLERSFPGVGALNRGFGGSQIRDSVQLAPRLFLKHRPRLVVLYAGDNDLAARRTPAQVLEDFKAFVAVVHRELPTTRIAFVCIKPSIARWKLVEPIKQANALVEAFCKKDARLAYVDIFTPMLGDDGRPRKELFAKDGLHLSEKGYELWTARVKPLLTPAPKP